MLAFDTVQLIVASQASGALSDARLEGFRRQIRACPTFLAAFNEFIDKRTGRKNEFKEYLDTELSKLQGGFSHKLRLDAATRCISMAYLVCSGQTDPHRLRGDIADHLLVMEKAGNRVYWMAAQFNETQAKALHASRMEFFALLEIFVDELSPKVADDPSCQFRIDTLKKAIERTKSYVGGARFDAHVSTLREAITARHRAAAGEVVTRQDEESAPASAVINLANFIAPHARTGNVLPTDTATVTTIDAGRAAINMREAERIARRNRQIAESKFKID